MLTEVIVCGDDFIILGDFVGYCDSSSSCPKLFGKSMVGSNASNSRPINSENGTHSSSSSHSSNCADC